MTYPEKSKSVLLDLSAPYGSKPADLYVRKSDNIVLYLLLFATLILVVFLYVLDVILGVRLYSPSICAVPGPVHGDAAVIISQTCTVKSFIGGILSGIGSLFGASAAKKQAELNAKMQLDFAQQGIRWKVRDAQKAGIHPLVALGAQTNSYNPVSLDTSGYSDFGQNVGRSIDAVMPQQEKVNDFTKTAQSLTLERMQLENAVVRDQLINSAGRTIRQAGNPPVGIGLPGLSEKGDAKDKILKIAGFNIEPSPAWSDTQDVTNRYGETVGDHVYGPSVTTADALHNLRNRLGWADRIKKRARDYSTAVEHTRTMRRKGDWSYY